MLVVTKTMRMDALIIFFQRSITLGNIIYGRSSCIVG